MRPYVTLVSLLMVVSGCSVGGQLRGRVSALRTLAEEARANGAERCAPRELALAEANLEFATIELSQGDAVRSAEHVDLAEAYVDAARASSPRERCVPSETPPAPAAPPPPGDADGDGIVDNVDRCPTEPEDADGFEDEDGCPEDQDTDGDGLRDSVDQCKTEPEDLDGFEDENGCPDPDNDGDGVLDAADQCPREPEDADGFRDEDGCPDPDNDADGVLDAADRCPNEAGIVEEQGCPRVYRDVVVTRDAIVINQVIHFQTNRAIIRPESFGILDVVVQVLRDYPNFRIEVQGHTDSRGNDAQNLRLSQARAESVRTYLVSHGIDAARLSARGYGETSPIESNLTEAGRASNRRVEFIRNDHASPTTGPN